MILFVIWQLSFTGKFYFLTHRTLVKKAWKLNIFPTILPNCCYSGFSFLFFPLFFSQLLSTFPLSSSVQSSTCINFESDEGRIPLLGTLT